MSGSCCDPSDKLNFNITAIPQQDCDPDVSCIGSTIGQPQDNPPDPKNDIFRYDACAGKLWFYTCDGGWQSTTFALCDLEELDQQVINDICNTLRIPAFYDANGCCAQGYFSMSDLAQLFKECLGCPPSSEDITPGDGKEIVYCNPDPESDDPLVKGEIDFPTVCDYIGDLTDIGSVIAPNQNFEIIDQATCSKRTVERCCPEIEVFSNGGGGGVCFTTDSTVDADGIVIYRFRDGTYVKSTGTTTSGADSALTTISVTNNFDMPSLAVVDVTSYMSVDLTDLSDVGSLSESYVAVLTDDMLEPFPYGRPQSYYAADYRDFAITPVVPTNNFTVTDGSDNFRSASSVKLTATKVLQPGETFTWYAQGWYVATAMPATVYSQIIHNDFYINGRIMKGVV